MKRFSRIFLGFVCSVLCILPNTTVQINATLDTEKDAVFEVEFIETHSDHDDRVEGGKYKFIYDIPLVDADGNDQKTTYMKVEGINNSYNFTGNSGEREITFDILSNQTYNCTLYTTSGKEYKTSFKVDYVTTHLYNSVQSDLTTEDYTSEVYPELSFEVLSTSDDGSFPEVYYEGENDGVLVMIYTGDVKSKITINGQSFNNDYTDGISFRACYNDTYIIRAQSASGLVTTCDLVVNFLQPKVTD